jgi:glycosyltransferase involved in cell wall biosynthesis
VDRLFREVEGDYIVLLHDDDRLLDGALEALLECFEDCPDTVAAYGKQQLTDAAGTVRREATRGLNRSYHRTGKYEGPSASSLRAAVLQQFPNDGYIVRADAAKQVGYDHPNAGNACDFAFGVELARQSKGTFYYTDVFTSQYRLSEDSIARGQDKNDAAYWAVKTVLERIPDTVRTDPEVRRWIRERIPVAIMRAAQNGHARDGLAWYFSRYHRRRIPTLGGLRRLALLFYSYLTH